MAYRRLIAVAIALGLFAVSPAIASAAPAPGPSPTASPEPNDDALPYVPPAVTHHHLALPGGDIAYTATAEFTTLDDKDGKPEAKMFSVAYERDGAPHAQRPVAFLWNGGPGSSSMWLHMGSFGPVRVPTNGTNVVVPPGTLVPNADSLLDAADLVFVDALGTGYSRLGPHAKKTDYYGIDQDARAFQQFITRWLSEHDRYGSPKFLIGESYGTTRAANVVDRLQEFGIGINGVVLISSALDYTAFDPALPGDDLPNVAFLPTEAAVAWYHEALPGQRPAALAPFLAEVRAYASGPYATALLRGDELDAATRADVIAHLVRYTGLGADYIGRADLRIDPSRFEKELERTKNGRITGRLDARFFGYTLDRNADSPDYDPTLDASIQDAFATQFNAYARNALHFRSPDPYKPAAYGELGPWNLTRDASDVGLANVQLPNVLPDLAQALTHNPALRVFSANGYFDLATPFYGTEIGLHHLGLDPALRDHVTYGYYPSGHMIYLENASRGALHADIARFIRGAVAP